MKTTASRPCAPPRPWRNAAQGSSQCPGTGTPRGIELVSVEPLDGKASGPQESLAPQETCSPPVKVPHPTPLLHLPSCMMNYNQAPPLPLPTLSGPLNKLHGSPTRLCA
ncbi:hypothetical protein E2C01_076988 [Portunus trituberculatus]|uniref:Uncharacterized protein n=1 Tax=Portunus trituberculatus TaxID=210409 RepID=A0A5B7IK00_PORTR|nr:hypothetical protein [Portunus trituberculatus]